MITTRTRRWSAALALSLAALLAPAAAASSSSPGGSANSPAGSAARAFAPATTAAAKAAGSTCPVVSDPLSAAADGRVDRDRITPEPSYRANCKQLYRADSRSPEVVFEEGFQPRDVVNGQYDLERYVLQNQPSPFVSTSYDHDLYKQWWKSGFNYYVDAPGGIDVNETIGDQHKWAAQVEVAFPGGVDTSYIVGACPVDKVKKAEIMAECVDNPHYVPWRG